MFSHDARQGGSRPPDELDALVAFIGERTGLSRRVITDVLDANDVYWDMLVESHGAESTARWAQSGVWDMEDEE